MSNQRLAARVFATKDSDRKLVYYILEIIVIECFLFHKLRCYLIQNVLVLCEDICGLCIGIIQKTSDFRIYNLEVASETSFTLE